MLEVALHNPRQHKQFRRESGPLVLARAGQEPALWTTVDEGEACPDARIEIVPQLAGVSLAVAGCEAECTATQLQSDGTAAASPGQFHRRRHAI